MKKHWIPAAALIFTLAAIPAVALIQSGLDCSIREDKLLDEQFAEEGGAPPLVAFTLVALGGFRSLAADFLWLRATRLQDEGRYFELVQLADWIQRLQPKNTTAAQFLAWNMAYNLSVSQQDFAARWRWIQKGLGTLQDALLMNPNDPLLYRDLGWIYQHKLGDQMDEAQLYYKYRLASELYWMFGGKHAPDWAALDAAPASEAEFLKRYPLRSKPWEKLRAAGYSSPEVLAKAFAETGELPPAASEALGEKDSGAFSAYFRRALILEKLHVEPRYALEMEQKYGKLDWLMPDTYAIYWGIRGVAKSPDRKSLECERLITQGLKISFTAGRILFPGREPSENFILLPNLDLTDAAAAEYRKGADLHPDRFDAGYATFLAQATEVLYLFGKREKARDFFLILRDKLRSGYVIGQTLEQFMNNRLRDMISKGTYRNIMNLIESCIVQSAFALANGERETAAQRLETARQIYTLYLTRNEKMGEKRRLNLPPFPVFKREVTQSLMRSIPELETFFRAEETVPEEKP